MAVVRKETLMDAKTLWAALGVLLISAAFVFAIIVTGNVTAEATPLISTVLGFAALIVTSLVSVKRVGDVSEKVTNVDEKVDRVLNGEMEAKIRQAVLKALEERGK